MSKTKFDNRSVRSSLEQISSDDLAISMLYNIYRKNKNTKLLQEYKKALAIDSELLNKIILYNTLLSLSDSDSKVKTLTKIKVKVYQKYYFISKDILTLPLKSLLNVLYQNQFKFIIELVESSIIIKIKIQNRDLSPLIPILNILKIKGDLANLTVSNNMLTVRVLDISLYNNILNMLSSIA